MNSKLRKLIQFYYIIQVSIPVLRTVTMRPETELQKLHCSMKMS
jgi:hypothetical protein